MSKSLAKALAFGAIVLATLSILLFSIYLPGEILRMAATAAATVLAFVFAGAVGAVVTFICAAIIISVVLIVGDMFIAGDIDRYMTPTIPLLATGVGAYAASAMTVASPLLPWVP